MFTRSQWAKLPERLYRLKPSQIFKISLAGLPKPNGRLKAQIKLAYPYFNT